MFKNLYRKKELSFYFLYKSTWLSVYLKLRYAYYKLWEDSSRYFKIPTNSEKSLYKGICHTKRTGSGIL